MAVGMGGPVNKAAYVFLKVQVLSPATTSDWFSCYGSSYGELVLVPPLAGSNTLV